MNKAKMLSVVLMLLMLFTSTGLHAKHTKPHGGAQPEAFVVINADTGKVIVGDHQSSPRYPASLTKMMTLYLLFEEIDQGKISLNDRLRVSLYAYNKFGDALGLKRGDTISVHDAILALAVKSANNVAVVVAESISGTEAAFAHLMTKKALQLGMNHTVFKNASGWFHKEHKTTAYDIAILLKTLHAKYPQYYKYLGQKTFSFNGEKYSNKNKLLGTYPGVDGGKTGFVSKAGFCLAVSAVRPSGRLVAVVMGEPNKIVRLKRMKSLLDLSFKKITKKV